MAGTGGYGFSPWVPDRPGPPLLPSCPSARPGRLPFQHHHRHRVGSFPQLDLGHGLHSDLRYCGLWLFHAVPERLYQPRFVLHRAGYELQYVRALRQKPRPAMHVNIGASVDPVTVTVDVALAVGTSFTVAAA